MPIYDCECEKCGIKEDIWARINELSPKCPECGRDMARLMSPTRGICDLTPYWDENLADARKAPQGNYVESRQDRKRKMKELGLIETGWFVARFCEKHMKRATDTLVSRKNGVEYDICAECEDDLYNILHEAIEPPEKAKVENKRGRKPKKWYSISLLEF